MIRQSYFAVALAEAIYDIFADAARQITEAKVQGNSDFSRIVLEAMDKAAQAALDAFDAAYAILQLWGMVPKFY